MSRTILAEVDGFTPVIDVVVKDTSLMTAVIFGGIWRYCQMQNGVCQSTLEKIAERTGVGRQTVIEHIRVLEQAGYIEDTTPDLRNRPHTYRDTGKAGLHIGVSTVRQTDSAVRQTDSAVRQTDSHSTPSVLEDSIKRGLKKDNTISSNSSSKKRPTPEGLPEPSGDALGDWIEMGRRAEEKNKPMVAIIEALASGFGYNFPHFGENKHIDRVARLIATDGRDVSVFINWAKQNKRDPHWYHIKPDTLWGDWPQAFDIGISVSPVELAFQQIEKERSNGSTL
jgi:DNA-binding Lrp family transcriptional regulator